jgi:glycosyltransferase involved in cell wall biosynthesis
MTLLTWAILVLVLVILAAGLDLTLGFRRLLRLADFAPGSGPAEPPVTIVVAARNEERGVERAARSLLAQRYRDLEIVIVDDRSTDRTGAILDGLAAQSGDDAHEAGKRPRLRVVHVRELPAGWLGKNHALSVGAAGSRGAWLLFTDADVVMQPDAVSRAVAAAERRGLDHLAVLPELRMRGVLGQAFLSSFGILGLEALRPWKARDPGSRRSVGVGAFNLVRGSAYARAGGHEPIRLRPDDDLKLGRILKRSGARQDVMLGADVVLVEWYHSLGEAIHGLSKNSFSAVEYNPLLMLGGAVGLVLVSFGPLAALVLGDGVVRLLGGIGVAVQVALQARMAGELRASRWTGLLYPCGALILAWIMVRTLVLNLRQGGIVWRETFYSLEDLRKNRV